MTLHHLPHPLPRPGARWAQGMCSILSLRKEVSHTLLNNPNRCCCEEWKVIFTRLNISSQFSLCSPDTARAMHKPLEGICEHWEFSWGVLHWGKWGYSEQEWGWAWWKSWVGAELGTKALLRGHSQTLPLPSPSASCLGVHHLKAPGRRQQTALRTPHN